MRKTVSDRSLSCQSYLEMHVYHMGKDGWEHEESDDDNEEEECTMHEVQRFAERARHMNMLPLRATPERPLFTRTPSPTDREELGDYEERLGRGLLAEYHAGWE